MVLFILFYCLVLGISSILAQPLAMDVFNTTPFSDENGNLLNDGDIIQLIWAGPDGTIDPPVKKIGDPTNGQPTGDDVILSTHTIGENAVANSGTFFFSLSSYPDHTGGYYPAAGDKVYIRAFNDSNLQNATFYGDAQ